MSTLTDEQRANVWSRALRRNDAPAWPCRKGELRETIDAIDDALASGASPERPAALGESDFADLVARVQWERDAPARGAQAVIDALEADRQAILADKAENLKRKYIRTATLAVLRDGTEAERLEALCRIVAGSDYRTRSGWEGV